MEKKIYENKFKLNSVSDNHIDIILLDAMESLYDLKKRRERIPISENMFTQLNKSRIYNDYIEVLYTDFFQFRPILFPIVNEIIEQKKKVIIFNCEASRILEDSNYEDENGVYVGFNSIAELINKLQILDVLIEDCGGDVGLVVVDKINYYYNKNVYINITEDYFNEQTRKSPQVLMKMNKNSKISGKCRRSNSIKKSEFGYIESAIMNLFRHHMKYNFNLIISQFDFSREKFISSLKFSQKGAIKQNFYNLNFIFNNILYNPFLVQMILPNEEESNDEIKGFCALRKENEYLRITYNDSKDNYEIRTIQDSINY